MQGSQRLQPGLAIVEVIIGEHQSWHKPVCHQLLGFGQINGTTHLAAPTAEQGAHGGQNVPLVVDTEHGYIFQLAVTHHRRRQLMRDNRPGRQIEGHRKDRPLARPALQCELMTEHQRDAAGDGKPQTQPLLLGGAGVIETGELVKNSLLLVLRDAGAVIPHLDADLVPHPAATEQHPAPRVVAKRIGEEVLQHPTQQPHIAVYRVLALHHREVDPPRLRQHAKLRLEVVEQIAQGEVELLGLELARFEPRDIEQIGDEILGRPQRIIDMAGNAGLLASIGQHLQQGGGKQLGRIEGLGQIVADRRQKTALGLIGPLHLLVHQQ